MLLCEYQPHYRELNYELALETSMNEMYSWKRTILVGLVLVALERHVRNVFENGNLRYEWG